MSESTQAVLGRRLPALDGVRAAAILGVMAYHLGFGWASGGYLGVDLFFVLSGFLITSLLVEEHGAEGRIRLPAFWARRARRLLPALFLVLVAVAVYAFVNGRFASPTTGGAVIDLSGLRSDAFATLLYVANWHLIFGHQSYFAQFSAPSPLQHTWSLAIEEQFYLVWPLVVVAIFTLAPRRWRRAGVVVALGGAVASAVAMGVLYHGGDPSSVYYGSETRAFDLLIGAALAMVCADRPQPGKRARTLLHAAAPAAAVGLGGFWWRAGTATGEPTAWMFQGGFFACALLAALVVADVRQFDAGPLARVLSVRPVRWVGQISYGLYLWHWPVIVYMTSARTGVSGYALDAAQVATTFAVATASYYLVELPIRQKRVKGLAMRALAPTAVAATVGVLLLGTSPSLASATTSHVWRGGGLEPGQGPDVAGAGGIATERPIVLPSGAVPAPGRKLRVLTIGDSIMRFAEHGVIAALQSTEEAHVDAAAQAGWGLTRPGAVSGLLHNIHEFRPQVIIGMWSWDDARAQADLGSYEQFLDSALARVLSGHGVVGVIFLQLPVFGPGVVLDGPSIVASAKGVDAWNMAVAHAASVFPGRVMYLPVASALEVNGKYSAWLPSLGTSTSSLANWVRVRSGDEVHLCPPGITRYAAPVLADMTGLFHLGPPHRKWWISPSITSAGFADSGAITCPADHPTSWSALPAGAASRANT